MNYGPQESRARNAARDAANSFIRFERDLDRMLRMMESSGMSVWLDFTNSRLYELELDVQRQRYEDDTAMLNREARSDQHDEARYDAHEDEHHA